ncbi:hypothetical protein Ae168Ps1_6257 [Pseudonocardia sp. Ae168_Ps1]|nr:hypothetical protein Ae168Ps1_6257 [Pseudonocardia sp. Ae168_Ps1]OLL71531.1 hypothetical protein Ae263Ps1_6019 [Pseudonocardia sp. Ae263_Ps1]OLM09515.1 hypothetical protein Ae706Ps2_5977c [Pseudonocardia sp. Ae706_Ps2]OLM27782.1 hypothetical protein Ae717Ps2_7000c [Pseudonocardia sp. Ae717_Ps2]
MTVVAIATTVMQVLDAVRHVRLVMAQASPSFLLQAGHAE